MKSKMIAMVLMLASTTTWTGVAQTIGDLKSCVTFVYLEKSNGQFEPVGTAFFTVISDTIHKTNFVYVVTSKHVLWNSRSKTFVQHAWIRLERTRGDLTYVKVFLVTTGQSQNTFTHPDSSVDLVAIQGAPDQEKYKYLAIPFDRIGSNEHLRKIGIEEGVDVVIPALFTSHIGQHQNYPITRFGKLALMSSGERIDFDGQLQRLHLIEAIAIGGHSGAPVFAWYHPIATKEGLMSTDYAKKRLRLIGVVEGYFRNWKKLEAVKSSVFPASEQHTGISAAVPVDLLSEILLGTEATNAREIANIEFEKQK